MELPSSVTVHPPRAYIFLSGRRWAPAREEFMRVLLVALLGLPAILGLAMTSDSPSEHDACAAPPGSGSSAAKASAARQESPLACDRMALSEEERKRHFDELGPMLRTLKKSVRELPNGYEFEFPGDRAMVQLVEEWAAQERACCPFFDITVRLEREEGSVWMGLTGRDGVKHFIEVDGAEWIGKSAAR
jgi:hypothetical protein